jgi:hypothetical protein
VNSAPPDGAGGAKSEDDCDVPLPNVNPPPPPAPPPDVCGRLPPALAGEAG